MTKIAYTNLKLKKNEETTIIDYEGNQIEVLKYLPINDKYSLINITMQEAQEGSLFNPVKLDMYFNLNLIYLYTNINFTEKQKDDENKLYDCLCSSGLMDQIISAIPEDEYELLYNWMQELIADTLNYKNTINGLIEEFVDKMPKNAEEMQKIVDNFDRDKFQNVLDFAKAANGGREIK